VSIFGRPFANVVMKQRPLDGRLLGSFPFPLRDPWRENYFFPWIFKGRGENESRYHFYFRLGTKMTFRDTSGNIVNIRMPVWFSQLILLLTQLPATASTFKESGCGGMAKPSGHSGVGDVATNISECDLCAQMEVEVESNGEVTHGLHKPATTRLPAEMKTDNDTENVSFSCFPKHPTNCSMAICRNSGFRPGPC
jgi:hypothetical protein